MSLKHAVVVVVDLCQGLVVGNVLASANRPSRAPHKSNLRYTHVLMLGMPSTCRHVKDSMRFIRNTLKDGREKKSTARTQGRCAERKRERETERRRGGETKR